ncbi:hypothetical protein EI555_016826 [Monodon monoceros]|uniref:Uncharacterized protein n=1 Tax=Monodon monoceros TaxID=40151 RepID=A0A4U1F2B6_MONMO|nr:hypothetical protein EI555_016826 [Monodon monoceros]
MHFNSEWHKKVFGDAGADTRPCGGFGVQHGGPGLAGAHGPMSSGCDAGPAHAVGPQPPGGGRPRGRKASRVPQAGVGIVSAASIPEAALGP